MVSVLDLGSNCGPLELNTESPHLCMLLNLSKQFLWNRFLATEMPPIITKHYLIWLSFFIVIRVRRIHRFRRGSQSKIKTSICTKVSNIHWLKFSLGKLKLINFPWLLVELGGMLACALDPVSRGPVLFGHAGLLLHKYCYPLYSHWWIVKATWLKVRGGGGGGERTWSRLPAPPSHLALLILKNKDNLTFCMCTYMFGLFLSLVSTCTCSLGTLCIQL